MKKREDLTKAGKTLYDILGGVIIVGQLLCIALCVYRNKVVLDGEKIPLSFIVEIILISFGAVVMIKQYKFMNKNIFEFYSFFNKVICGLNWVFVVILFGDVIIHVLY